MAPSLLFFLILSFLLWRVDQVRLYSIASTRYGDDGDGRTVSLCVRRATVLDPETGKEDPAKEVRGGYVARGRPS